MTSARSIGVLFFLLCAAAAPIGRLAAQGIPLPGAMGRGGDPLEERVARLERILENQRGSDLMLQMQQLVQEMQELRGLVETQQFELQKIQRQQRDQFMDIDARLNGGQAGVPAGPESPATELAPVTPETRAAAAGIDASGQDLKPPVGSDQPPPASAPTPSSPGAVGIPSLPSPETTAGNERDGYRDAFELLKQRKYELAVNAFNDLLRRFPQGQYTDSARYWLAETYYVQRNYPAALAELDRLVQLSPNSPKVPGAMLKIGYIQYEQEAYDQARAALQTVVTKYPDSTEARLAKSRLERIGRERR